MARELGSRRCHRVILIKVQDREIRKEQPQGFEVMLSILTCRLIVAVL